MHTTAKRLLCQHVASMSSLHICILFLCPESQSTPLHGPAALQGLSSPWLLFDRVMPTGSRWTQSQVGSRGEADRMGKNAVLGAAQGSLPGGWAGGT